jgi:hypothetical protein
LVGGKRWECAACGHQVSLTTGTVLHNTKTPLTVWFWAAYLLPEGFVRLLIFFYHSGDYYRPKRGLQLICSKNLEVVTLTIPPQRG